jgi:hypothetical protein
MDWRTRAWNLIEQLEQVPHPKWLPVASALAALLLLLALIATSMRNLSLRQRLAERAERGPGDIHSQIAGWEDELPPISLEGEGRALIDRVLPRQPRAFLLTVAAVAIGCWAAGLALTTNISGFLSSREWQLQPLYLAAHFITLRLFATMFTRNFLSGIVHLDMAPTNARRGTRLVLGPVGAIVALVIAVPFCLYDYQVRGGDGLGRDVGRLLFGMWCAEWFMMAFIWVQMLGFLFLTRSAIGEHEFRAPIEVVLLEKQYRPFLQMSAQGATIVLGYFLANAIYVLYTGAELSDYLGVAITLVLLVVGFVPPWLQLTAKVDRSVKAEMSNLRRRLASSEATEAAALAEAGQPQAARSVEERLAEALVMLRISYLERLYGDLGRMEAKSIVMKVLVPAATIGYYVLSYFKG